MSNRFDIRTYGCKVNTYDTGLLQKRLVKSGYLFDSGQPEVHIVNTCAVTAEATKQAQRDIRYFRRKNPDSLIVVTGCAAQVDTECFADMPETDLVVANSHKGQIEELIQKHLQGMETQKVFKSNIFKKEDLEAGGGVEKGHTRSFLKIQDGCNSFCTFCVIPFARGKSRSISIDNLVAKVNELYSEGLREVVITGIHIGDYEDESRQEKNKLEDLVEELLLKTSMPRFRISSLEPIELSPRLLELYSDERMCPHFHMSIQSANTKVLKDMKRKYGAEEVEESLIAIDKKLSNAFVGMDVIAGFPGESEEEFMDTYNRLASLPWTRIHVFPYSQRPGTYATRIEPQIKPHIIASRAAKLRELSSERYAQKALDQIGCIHKAMILKNQKQALTRNYWTVSLENEVLSNIGKEIEVSITGYDHSEKSRMQGCLVGEACEKLHSQ